MKKICLLLATLTVLAPYSGRAAVQKARDLAAARQEPASPAEQRAEARKRGLKIIRTVWFQCDERASALGVQEKDIQAFAIEKCTQYFKKAGILCAPGTTQAEGEAFLKKSLAWNKKMAFGQLEIRLMTNYTPEGDLTAYAIFIKLYDQDCEPGYMADIDKPVVWESGFTSIAEKAGIAKIVRTAIDGGLEVMAADIMQARQLGQ